MQEVQFPIVAIDESNRLVQLDSIRVQPEGKARC